MRRLVIVGLGIALMLSSTPALQAQVTASKKGARYFYGEMQVNAKPEKIWAKITDLSLIGEMMGEKMEKAKKVSKEGEWARVTTMGDMGTLFVTVAKKNQELRLYFEPDNASYTCRERYWLTPDGDMTTFHMELEYTESGSGPEADKMADDLAKDMSSRLGTMKMKLEGK
jgi:hypothetical protein